MKPTVNEIDRVCQVIIHGCNNNLFWIDRRNEKNLRQTGALRRLWKRVQQPGGVCRKSDSDFCNNLNLYINLVIKSKILGTFRHFKDSLKLRAVVCRLHVPLNHLWSLEQKDFYTIRRTCLVNEATEHVGGNWCHFARLADDGITTRQRRCHLEREQVERQVPRADECRHADCTTLGVVERTVRLNVPRPVSPPPSLLLCLSRSLPQQQLQRQQLNQQHWKYCSDNKH